MKHLLAVCSALLLIVCATPLFADTPTEEQMMRLVQVTGIQEQLEAQRSILAGENEKSIRLATLALAHSPRMNQEMRKYMQEEIEHFLAEADKAYDTDSLVRDYARLMREQLSASDVEALIAFHESELGALYVKANIAITEPWMKKFTEEYSQRMLSLMQEFTANLAQKMMDMQQKKNDANES